VIWDAMSVEAIEHELAWRRTSEGDPPDARACVVNVMVVTSEEFASAIDCVVSDLSSRHPSRTILVISDPDEAEANLEISLSTFCGIERGADRICAEQITVHVEGPPAEHLESLAGPLLIPDLPAFLWYPNATLPDQSSGMLSLTNRLILDSGPAEDHEAFLRAAFDLCRTGVPAVADLQWTALSLWRALVADLFTPPERAGDLPEITRVEVQYGSAGESQALLLAGWLASALDWRPEQTSKTESVRKLYLSAPSGMVTIDLHQDNLEPALSLVRLRSRQLTLEIRVSRRGEHACACTTVKRAEKILGERTVRLCSSSTGALLSEELCLPGRDLAYEAALHKTVEMLCL
jgi:glucose-6-phosphate dehydrogenase assembly protein OpcA